VGIVRVLTGLAVAIGVTGAWILLACVVAGVTLYIARLVPMTGRRKPPESEI
jgi:hypothetical protein